MIPRISSKIQHITACLILFCFVSAFANAGILDDMDDSPRELVLVIGETQPLSVVNPRQVKIGNPDLLDVVGAGRTELLLSGLKAGETQLTVVDDRGQRIYNVKVYDEDLEKIKERVDILLETAGFDHLSTKIGDKERKIFIIGEVTTSGQASFESAINSVTDKIINLVRYIEEPASVQIDVEVLEIAKTDLDNLGFTWNETVAFSEPISNVPSNFPIDNLLQPKHVLQILKDWRTTQFSATLNMLKQDNKARTLSRPKLVCMSGKEARLLVGGERPIITGSTTSSEGGATTTDYEIELKEYGISLQIKPEVRQNDEIQISLEVAITEVDETNQLTLSSGVTTPGFTERSAQTNLFVSNGQTIFLAGLIKSYDQDNRDAVPFLGRIPFFGALFRHKDLELTETEVVISLTPTILRTKPVSFEPAQQEEPTTPKISPQSQELKSIENRTARQNDPVFHYTRLIQDIIISNIDYPSILKEESIAGAVNLSLHLLSSGELSGVIVMQSSGSAVLDETAAYSVRKLSPFPAFPSEIQLNELWIEIPIVYKK